MSLNPNPALITDPMWRLWTDRPNPLWKLSGIYANKKGYHNTVIANLANWPGTYSIRLPLDLVKENRDKARAIDLTMSDTEMVKWTRNMKNSAENPNDHRLAAVREFYGTLDNQNVFGLIKDNEIGPWRESSADLTHLWHGHTSIFTKFVDNWLSLAPILTVWRGSSFAEWSEGSMGLPELHDSGEEVKLYQYIHNTVRNLVSPPAPELVIDGDYGDKTAAAFAYFWKKRGGIGTFTGELITGWLALQYQKALAVTVQPTVIYPKPTGPTPEQIQEALKVYFSTNALSTKFEITGQVDAKALPS